MNSDKLKKSIPHNYLDINKLALFLSLALVFLISSIYFKIFGYYIFFFQEQQSLFVFSSEYFQQFVSKPGGLLLYAGNFITQFYYNTLYGSVILSSLFCVIALAFIMISKKLSRNRAVPFSLIVIPSLLLLLIQTNFNWLVYNNLGFLLAILFFYFSISSKKKNHGFIVLFLLPFFYYFAGAYVLIYIGIQIIYNLLWNKGRDRFFNSVYLLIIAFLTFLLFKEVLYFQPGSKLLQYPLPFGLDFLHPELFYILSGFIVLFPLFLKGSLLFKGKVRYAKFLSLASVSIVFILTIFSLTKFYDSKIANLFYTEKKVYEQDWDAVIEHQEAYQSRNIIAQFYYNLALSESGQLCERLFSAPQNYGPNSLVIAWNTNASIHTIYRGAYFFYSIGMINEAHRWAYESMVSQGFRPDNIKLLIKTDLINGRLHIAEKYINILKKTFHYREWAEKYEAMIKNPSLIISDVELGEKIRLLPSEDFSISVGNPISNIPLLLDGKPDNKKAFEYLQAWYLLQKNIDEIVKESKRMAGMSYTEIPNHIEEALYLYTIHEGTLPDLGGLEIKEETKMRFQQYTRLNDPLRDGAGVKNKAMLGKSRYSFWYYVDFE